MNQGNTTFKAKKKIGTIGPEIEKLYFGRVTLLNTAKEARRFERLKDEKYADGTKLNRAT